MAELELGAGVPGDIMISGQAFAEALSLFLQRPLIDQTGIDGLFNFELKWTPDEMVPLLGSVAQLPSGAPAVDPADPSLLSALEEQLGLKLIKQRPQIDMLVIDHLQEIPTPTAN